MMEKLRIGIIGVGGMGQSHCKVCREIEEIELTAVSDADPKTASEAAQRFGVKSYPTYQELIDSGAVDAVIVATPHYMHPVISIYAMKKGLHVLSEKPIAVTVDKADEMIKTAKKTKRIFSVMFQMHAEPHYIAAKKLIDEGRVGKIYRTLLVIAWYRTQAYYNSASWRATWKTEGGGVLINQAPHLLDIFCWLCGLPSEVFARINTKRHKIEVEDEVHALLKYKNGASGYLHASVNEAPGMDRMEICGEKGKLTLEGNRVQFTSVKTPIQEFTDTSTEMWAVPEVQPEEVKLEPRETEHKAIIRNFAQAILHGKELLTPGSEAIKSLELANAIILSGKTNKPVKIPVDRKKIVTLYRKLVKNSKPRNIKEAKRQTDTKFK